MAECIHGMTKRWCSVCTPPARVPRYDRGTVITAQYDSDCPRCGGQIYAGDDLLVRDGQYMCSAHIEDRDDDDPFA